MRHGVADVGKQRHRQRNQADGQALQPGTIRPAPAGDPSPGKSATAAPASPAFPGFRIIGKQQDDNGWSVFIGEPGKQGQVWVVREGESFNEHFHVSKLSPPALIIKDTRSRKSKNFDIGKDEE